MFAGRNLRPRIVLSKTWRRFSHARTAAALSAPARGPVPFTSGPGACLTAGRRRGFCPAWKNRRSPFRAGRPRRTASSPVKRCHGLFPKPPLRDAPLFTSTSRELRTNWPLHLAIPGNARKSDNTKRTAEPAERLRGVKWPTNEIKPRYAEAGPTEALRR